MEIKKRKAIKKLCGAAVAALWVCSLTACGNQAGGSISLDDIRETVENIGAQADVNAESATGQSSTTGTTAEPEENIAGSSTEHMASQVTASQENNTSKPGTEMERRRAAYVAALEGIYSDKKLPDGWALDSTFVSDSSISGNHFAVYDVDGDGADELIVEWINASMAGMIDLIYDYDDSTGEIRLEWSGFPSVTFYDNGVLVEDFSHNQGRAGDALWPYFLHQYDAKTDSYVQIASVDAWDKSLSDKDWDGNLFPDEIDVDKDGVLYYLMIGEMSYYDSLVDRSEYQSWRDSYTGKAKEIKLPFMDLTKENIHSI
ncbi:MAG: hypothetical protein J1E64_11730 [Acetatifactor sp.]|nr:hypothetical protein [Acetatifactor sp.]